MIDISVVIPTFRRPGLLLEAIASVLGQGARTEIIVLDDSPEASAKAAVAGLADERIQYVHCDPPSGGRPALVRNLGWRHAVGRVVHFLDDDDRVGHGFYERALHEFEHYPRSGVVFGRVEPFTSDPAGVGLEAERRYFRDARRRARLAARLGFRHWMVASLLFHQTLLVNSACLIRRECIAELGGYDIELGLNEDVDFYCRAIRRFGYRFLDTVAVNYRIQANSLIHGREDDRRLHDAYERMYARYRSRHGWAELLAIKLFARTILKLV